MVRQDHVHRSILAGVVHNKDLIRLAGLATYAIQALLKEFGSVVGDNNSDDKKPHNLHCNDR